MLNSSIHISKVNEREIVIGQILRYSSSIVTDNKDFKKILVILKDGLNHKIKEMMEYVLKIDPLLNQCSRYINKNKKLFSQKQINGLIKDLRKLILKKNL